MKFCSRCGIEKDEGEFFKNVRKKDGLNNYCKECACKKGKLKQCGNENEMKVCNRCGEEKLLNSSSWRKNSYSSTGFASICKVCDNVRWKVYQEKNRKKINERGKIWRENNRGKCNEMQKSWRQRNKERCSVNRRNCKLKKNYGIDLKKYNELYEKQDGKCLICGKQYDKLVVDHNHETGMVRGLLCNSCNPILGYAYEDIKILKKCISYLQKTNKEGE